MKRRTEDGGLRARGVVACVLMIACGAPNAEELPDPTRIPAIIVAPVAVVGVAAAPAGLQSIIISKTRRAAIIDGETVELGGKHGDAKLIEVNEGSVVLSNLQGRRVLTLFPDVKITGRELAKEQSPASVGKVQSGRKKSAPAVRQEKE